VWSYAELPTDRQVNERVNDRTDDIYLYDNWSPDTRLAVHLTDPCVTVIEVQWHNLLVYFLHKAHQCPSAYDNVQCPKCCIQSLHKLCAHCRKPAVHGDERQSAKPELSLTQSLISLLITSYRTFQSSTAVKNNHSFQQSPKPSYVCTRRCTCCTLTASSHYVVSSTWQNWSKYRYPAIKSSQHSQAVN